MRFGGRRSTTRVEDERLLTGGDRYTDNLVLPNQAHMVVVRSPHAHAVIRSIDTEAAAAMEGVLAVLTGADLVADGVEPLTAHLPIFKRPDGKPAAAPPRRLLAFERARHVGEPVAAVVAETRAQAIETADAVIVDYEPLDAVVDVRDATAPGAPELWAEAPGNVAAEARYGDAAKVAEAFSRAARTISLDLVVQRLAANPMEPRASVGEYDAASGRYTLHTGSQTPSGAKQLLTQFVLKVPPEQVRVLVRDIGGGFGMRASLHPEDALTLYAAVKLKRAVKWRAERSEDLLADVQGRDHFTRAELALDGDGRILALRVDNLANAGAYLVGPTLVIPLALWPKVITGVYDVPLCEIRARVVLSNTMTVGAYRGAGRPEANYVIERLIDAAASEMKLDPAELRRRNYVRAAAMPYRNANGETYDSGDFERMLNRALEIADWDGFPARRAEAAARGYLLGRGLSSYIEWTGGNQLTETVDLIVHADGRVVVHSATQAMGQGLETTYTGMVAERLGVDPAAVTIIQGDTDLVQGLGTVGSRSAFVGGSAIAAGADELVEAGTRLAADALEAAPSDIEFADGRFVIAGTDRAIGMFELAGRQPQRRFAVKTTHTVEAPSWPNGCHVCEIEIDPETGVAAVARYVTVDDIGNALNETLVRGQIHGGIAQGIGQALYEHALYDRESGQFVAGSFMDYTMPRADGLPSFAVTLDQTVPCRTNRLGVKGCGESGTVGAAPTVMSAILDALRPLGVTHLDMPATPLKVWEAIRRARGAA